MAVKICFCGHVAKWTAHYREDGTDLRIVCSGHLLRAVRELAGPHGGNVAVKVRTTD